MPDPSVLLRSGRAEDLTGVTWLLAEADLPTAGLPWDLRRFIVAERAGRLIGAAGLERYGRSGLLRSVVVASEARKAGLGAALVERVLADSVAEGVIDVYLLTTTAEQYFLRDGFERIPRDIVPASVQSSVEFREACPATAAVMHRRLASSVDPSRDAVRMAPMRVLFLCTGNSARSQIAEAILNHAGGGRFLAASAGTKPAERVNPFAIEILARYGLRWGGRAPRGLQGIDQEHWDFVITVCDRAREACPIFPGQPVIAHWGMADPAGVDGTDDEKRRAFDDALLLIRRRIDLLLSLPIQKLERLALEQRVRAIGQTSREPAQGKSAG
jgi:protein-tyrosine-phosphatase/N-acetylglutamate synthase-like GNAT family acetyltransferase